MRVQRVVRRAEYEFIGSGAVTECRELYIGGFVRIPSIR